MRSVVVIGAGVVGASVGYALAKLGIRSHLAPRRSRYFVFRGDQREHEALRTAIAHRLQPYPKRAG